MKKRCNFGYCKIYDVELLNGFKCPYMKLDNDFVVYCTKSEFKEEIERILEI
jgi:hypothetical protein